MKMLARISMSFLLGLLSLGITQNVNASSGAPQLCKMVRDSLTNSGYSENTAYTETGIKQLLTNMNVLLPNLSSIDANKSYNVTYNCSVDHQLGRAFLKARPVNDNDALHVVTLMSWEVTGVN
jgi:hypothetical protein